MSSGRCPDKKVIITYLSDNNQRNSGEIEMLELAEAYALAEKGKAEYVDGIDELKKLYDFHVLGLPDPDHSGVNLLRIWNFITSFNDYLAGY